MVICLERGADLHMAQLMSLPLTVSCFSKIQIGFTFLVLAHLGSPGQGPLNGVCVCLSVVCLTHCGWSQCGLSLWCAIVLGDVVQVYLSCVSPTVGGPSVDCGCGVPYI